MDDLQAKHRKEQRDLQSRITQKKNSATKKTRKAVHSECEGLERSLKEKQDREIAELDGVPSMTEHLEEDEVLDDPVSTAGNEDTKATMNGPARPSNPDQISDGAASVIETRKPNRTKARLARRAAEQEALVARAADEAAAMPDLREQERSSMAAEVLIRGLEEKEVRPDGHCLYSAVADQLNSFGPGWRVGKLPKSILQHDDKQQPDYKCVRLAAADHIDSNPQDFEPFLEEPLSEYTHKIRETAEWGGHLELLAISRAYRVGINVLQGDGKVEEINSDDVNHGDGATVWLAYYRHSFGLGEHYNSLRRTKTSG
ncbi:MAG: hypothetical protein M1816_007720 [Peltula sp. TS41687]|nr:MAG: hypothetical protein M1816_007720 [Peltula sp. TS41687]